MRSTYRAQPARLPVSLWLALALVVGGCFDKSADDYVASAKRYVEKKDNAAATIELRNALQKSPKHVEAHFLLGRLLLEQGAPGSALVEIQAAITLGRTGDDVQFALAEALFKTGQFERLISEFNATQFADPGRTTTLHMQLGHAHLARGATKEAAAVFQKILQSQPDHADALLGQARLAAMGKDFASANKIADAVIAKSPTLAEALFFKAELLTAQADLDGALRTLDTLLQAEPRHVPGHQARVQIHLAREQLDRAGAALVPLQKIAPNDPRTLYMQALVAFRKGQLAEARDSIAKVLAVTRDHSPSVLLAGLIAYQLRDYAAAEGHLRPIVAKSPAAAVPRRVLAATLLESGQPERVIETLGPLLNAKDANAHAIAGEAYLALGEKDKALTALQRSAQLDPKSARVMMKLGETRLAMGELDQAIGHLEAASTSDRDAYRADLLLVANYLKRGDIERALKAAAVLEEKQPKNPLTHSLIADVHFAGNNTAEARKRLDRALALKADFVPALAGLARLDAREGRLTAAKERYERVVKEYPANDGAWLGLANVLTAAGARPARVAATLDKAVAAAPSSMRLHIALVQAHLRAGDARAALNAARRAESRFKNEPAIVELLGLAEQAAGEHELALATFGRLAALQPNTAPPLVRLAETQLAMKDAARALATADKALGIAPDSLAARHTRAVALVALGKKEDALATTRALQKRVPAQAAGYLMEGEVAARLADWATAEAALRRAHTAHRSIETVIALYGALERAGKRDEAASLANRWLKDYPKDVALRTVMGQRALAEKNYDRAATAYRGIVDNQPSNAAGWNNLAWIAMRQGDNRASEFAERALALAPDNPQVKDTLGTILSSRGETKRALTLLRDAATEAPDLFEIRLNLGRALLKAGEKESARKELEVVAKQDRDASSRDEAKALLGRN